MSAAEAVVRAIRTPGAVTVRDLRDGEEAAWDRFVYASPSGSPCHLTKWADIVEKSLGHKCFRLVAERDGAVTGVFPVSLVRSPLFGDCLVSMPLAVYGGVCADDRVSYDGLLKAGRDIAEKLGVRYLELRNRSNEFPTDLPGRDLYVTFTQDLSPGPEKLMAGLPRDTRYMVRKSIKNGLEWTEDIGVDDFYELYARSVHRLGTPVFSKELFARFQRAFGKDFRIFGVRKYGVPIASVCCFYFRERVMPYYGGSLARYNKESPNNFMYWKLIEQSCKEQYGVFDFGRSKKGTGASIFKSSWNMQMADLPYRYSLHTATEVPRLSPVDPKFQAPVKIWKRLPYPVTKILGPHAIRWIPSV